MKSLETSSGRFPETSAEKANEKMTLVEGFSPAGLKVLVVDDDPVCLMILETMLRQCNYAVTTCQRAAKALGLLRENKSSYDLVMSDVYMPDMDGFKLLEAIGLELDLPVIMMSANGETEVVMKGITHGACDYLLKPVRIEELRNIWQHVIRRRGRGESIKDDHLGDWDETGRGIDSPSEGDHSSKKRKEMQDPVDEPLEDVNSLKKARVVWSVELHQQFVNAVNQLSIDSKYVLDDSGSFWLSFPASYVRVVAVRGCVSRLEGNIALLDQRGFVAMPQFYVEVPCQCVIFARLFSEAVPKRILEIMNVQGLSRENVASHLQKYRQYLKRLSGVNTQPYPVASFQAAQAGNFAGSMQIQPGGRGVAAASCGKIFNVPLSGSNMGGLSRRPAQIDAATLSTLAQLQALQQGHAGILSSSMLGVVNQLNVGVRPGSASCPPNPAFAGLQRMNSLELDMLMKAALQDSLSRQQGGTIISDEMFELGKGPNSLAPRPIGIGNFKREDELDSLPGFGPGMSHVFGPEKLGVEMGPPSPYPALSKRGLLESSYSSGFSDYGPSDKFLPTSSSEISVSLLTQVFPQQTRDDYRSGHCQGQPPAFSIPFSDT